MTSNNTNPFELATRQAIRYQLPEGYTPQGQLTTEQLWKVKKDTLIAYEEVLTDEVEKFGKTNRRKSVQKTNQQELLELQLAVVTRIIDVREEEEQAALTQAERDAHNAPILERIAKQQYENMSIEELKKALK